MKEKPEPKEKFCGNCRYHNTYEYPKLVFCFVQYQKRNNPVVSALYCCDQWEFKPQGCFCLEDASKKGGSKRS